MVRFLDKFTQAFCFHDFQIVWIQFLYFLISILKIQPVNYFSMLISCFEAACFEFHLSISDFKHFELTNCFIIGIPSYKFTAYYSIMIII